MAVGLKKIISMTVKEDMKKFDLKLGHSENSRLWAFRPLLWQIDGETMENS